jgi:hypothetical protein
MIARIHFYLECQGKAVDILKVIGKRRKKVSPPNGVWRQVRGLGNPQSDETRA